MERVKDSLPFREWDGSRGGHCCVMLRPKWNQDFEFALNDAELGFR
jgi:hypothetical protein